MRQQLALGWVSFAFLALGASPAHFWLDSGELSSAGAELGVMHPPGTPGLAPLLHLAGLLPLGSVGFRMGLVSCALAAGAIVLMASILRRRQAHWAIVWGAATWVLAGLTFVRSARVVEIYALAAFLTLAFVWGFDPRVDEPRRLRARLLGTMAAVVGVWSFGDLRLALVPIVVVSWAIGVRRAEPWARWAPLVVAASSLAVLTLPLASAHGPQADWGNPQTLGDLWAHLQAQPIRTAFADEILPASLAAWSLNTSDTFGRLVEDIGPFGPVLAVAAVILWSRRPGDRGLLGLLVVLIGVELFYAVGINPMGGRDRQTGITLGLLVALVIGINLHAWSSKLVRARWAVLPLAWVVLVLPAAAVSLDDGRTTRSWMPHAWTRGALAQLPPGALLLTQSDDLSAGVLAARTLEGARPDLVSVPAQHLHKGGPDAPAEREAQVWSAASHGGSERARIVDVLTHPPRPPAPVAVELPKVGVFRGIPFEPNRGRVPLGLSGRGRDRDYDRAASLERSFSEWESRIESPRDALVFARAVDSTLRGWIGQGTSDANLLALAESTYLRVLADVAPDEPGAMLSLAAVHDATGRPASAIRLARKALELEPGRNGAMLSLALFLSRDPAGHGEARALAERAVALRPHRPRELAPVGPDRPAAGRYGSCARSA